MRRKEERFSACGADVVFQPALTPMEAAVLPARERKSEHRSALHMAQDDRIWARVLGGQDSCTGNQREKICVR